MNNISEAAEAKESHTVEVASVFGSPYRSPAGTILIPVASVKEAHRSGSSPASARTASPRAIIELDEKGVRIRELTNSTLLGFAGIVLVAWNVFWIAKTVRAFAKKR